jgi:hypothetical protein
MQKRLRSPYSAARGGENYSEGEPVVNVEYLRSASEADRAELLRVHRKDAAQLRELADLTTEIVAYLEGIEASNDKEVQG